MSDIDSVAFFADNELLADPYDYLAALRDECPLRREKHHGVVMVTVYDEGMAIYNDTDRFSSCISVTGPFPGFPVSLEAFEGEGISALIAAHRDELPFYDQLPTFGPPVHTRTGRCCTG
jgi:cytochrome P450 family 150 subfamily A5